MKGALFLAVAASFAVAVAMVGDMTSAATRPFVATATLATSYTRGESPPGRRGDVTVESWRITDRNGHRIGRMLLACTWVVSRARFCVGEINKTSGRNQGTIQVQGSSPSRFRGVYAVTGGTGIYESGGGTMRFTAIGARKNVLNVTITT